MVWPPVFGLIPVFSTSECARYRMMFQAVFHAVLNPLYDYQSGIVVHSFCAIGHFKRLAYRFFFCLPFGSGGD